MVPGATPSSPGAAAAGGSSAAPSGGGGLADALAQALSARNKKVSASGKFCSFLLLYYVGRVVYGAVELMKFADDEDEGDDWDDK